MCKENCGCQCHSKEELELKVKFVRDYEYDLEYVEGKSDWIDLRCAETTVLKKGQAALIPLGVAMQLPKGYEAVIAPRSSTFKNFHVLQTNSIGVVDETYCGDADEWRMPVYATEDVTIEKGDRICQFRLFEHQSKLKVNKVEALGNADRGGFGSTGTK